MTLVCIAGMHRSGTSLATGMLQHAGLQLGDQSRLMSAKADNAEGFFEHLDFVALNDELLELTGSAWDMPPSYEPAWASDASLDAARARAAGLIASNFASGSGRPGGWKDPRNSLTLPFWRSVCPDLRTVVCLRNPLAVARSLAARNGSSMRFGLELWKEYHQALLHSLPAGPYLVAHYDSLVTDPVSELGRIADFIGLEVSLQTIVASSAGVRRQARSELPDSYPALKRTGDVELLKLYDHFRALAGPVYQTLAECESHPPASTPDSPAMAPTHKVAADQETIDLRHQLSVEAARADEVERWLSAIFAGKVANISRSAPMAWGTTIQFVQGGDSTAYTLHGWSAAETEGTWTDGNGASLVLPKMPPVPYVSATIALRAAPFQAPGQKGQPVEVRVNGHPVAVWNIAQPGEYTAEFNTTEATSGPHWTVELAIAEPHSPQDLGTAPDRRRLGLCIASLTVSCSA